MIERSDVLLSVQRALLGAVPSSLRGVACGWNDKQITLRFIFDGPIDPDEEQDMNVVGTEVIADFHAPATIDEQVIRVDSPNSLSGYALQAWAYIRKEARDDNTSL
jgi:hypothetical protein